METENIVNLEKWKQFLETYYKDSILQLCNHYPQKRSLTISFLDLHNFDSEYADLLLENPRMVLFHLEEALHHLDWLPQQTDLSKSHVRVINLIQNIPIRDLRSEHLNHFISLEGMIRKTTVVYPKMKTAIFRCTACDSKISVEQYGNKVHYPINGCTNPLCKKKDTLHLLSSESIFEDTQNILLQESPESVRNASNPQTIEILFQDDLTGSVSPGDRVIITGILESIQKQEGKSRNYTLCLRGNQVNQLEKDFDELSITSEDEQQIQALSQDPHLYERMVQSVAPSIYGTKILQSVKQAILLQLFSGVRKQLPDGSIFRGDIHILLVGDPGVAKSQLLRYVVNLSPRGVLTSGRGSTASGLTATAVRDELGDGRWSIEGGALVMANNGIASIDEMDKMKEEDRSALHEAMEQQTISIAKAGILATLKSQCSILGASNPKSGRFNFLESMSEQINMPPSLLSRFDLIYVLTDHPEEEMDQQISKHILQNHYLGEKMVREEQDLEQVEDFLPISRTLLQKYIAYAKMNIHPVMREEAKEHIQNFYTSVRKVGINTSTISITARQLEALIRLAEASAKLRLCEEVTLEDAKLATKLTSDCLKQIGFDPETGEMDIDYITTGERKSRKEKIKIIKQCLKTIHYQQNEQDVPLSKVIEMAQEKGISEEDAKEILIKIHQWGGYLEKGLGYIHIILHTLDNID